MIIWVSVVLRRTVCGDIDWHFNHLSGSHQQSQLSDDFCSCCRNVGQCQHKRSFSQDFTHPDDHTSPTYHMSPGFKPFPKAKHKVKIYNETAQIPHKTIRQYCSASIILTVKSYHLVHHSERYHTWSHICLTTLSLDHISLRRQPTFCEDAT